MAMGATRIRAPAGSWNLNWNREQNEDGRKRPECRVKWRKVAGLKALESGGCARTRTVDPLIKRLLVNENTHYVPMTSDPAFCIGVSQGALKRNRKSPLV